jgi:hypothetical protein
MTDMPSEQAAHDAFATHLVSAQTQLRWPTLR